MSRKQLKISIPTNFYNDLQKLAKLKKLPPSTLARLMLSESLSKELSLQKGPGSYENDADSIMYLDDILSPQEGPQREIKAATPEQVFSDHPATTVTSAKPLEQSAKQQEFRAGQVTVQITINN